MRADRSTTLAAGWSFGEGQASATLSALANSGWETVFGSVDKKSEKEKTESLKRAAASVVTPTKPWAF